MGLFQRLRNLTRLNELDHELDREMSFHVRERADELISSGMSADEALRTARRQFGNIGFQKEKARDADICSSLESVVQDLGYAVRSFRQTPAFTVTAILAIGLGIGATTAVFSVVDLILFRSLPYANGERLVSVGVKAGSFLANNQEFLFAGDYIQWRDKQTAFESFTAWAGSSDCDLTENQPTRLACAAVASSFLPTLGVKPLLGRNFTREEDLPNGPKVVLVSYPVWRSRYGSDPGIVGRTISLDGQPVRIIGVLPQTFELPTLEAADLVVPQALQESVWTSLGVGRLVWAYARLKPGQTAAQGQAELNPLFEEYAKGAKAAGLDFKLYVRSLRDRQIGEARVASWILFGAVLAVLLIACANVANLLLARGAARQREIAIRGALGAGRFRLVRQSLTESSLLGMAGGLAGCGIAYALIRLFISIAPDGIPRLQQANLDDRVLLFTTGVSIAAGLLFGILPAMQPAQTETILGLRATGTSRHRVRSLLIALQLAVSVILLTSAGLLLRTLWNTDRVNLGLDHSESVYAARIALGRQRYSHPNDQVVFFQALKQRLEQAPGLSAFAIASSIPPDVPFRMNPVGAWKVEGVQEVPSAGIGGVPVVVSRVVTSGYFTTLGIPLRGRDFQDEDSRPGSNSIILSQEFARRLFGQEEPLLKQLRFLNGVTKYTVIGVAGNVRNRPLTAANDPEFYLAAKSHGDPPAANTSMNITFGRVETIVVRSSLTERGISDQIRSQVTAIDPTIPVTVDRVASSLNRLTARSRFNAFLLTAFAAVGLVIAVIGLYGVISFLVTQRTHEIGVRMAIGATPRNVLNLVLLNAARWTLVGTGLGVTGAIATTRLLRGLLFQIPERDPWSLFAAVLILIVVALAAAWIPARRGARIDPLQALRHD